MNDQCCQAQFEATVKVFALVSVQVDHKGIPWLETIAYHSADITLMMKQLFYSEWWCWSIRCKWKLIRWKAAQRSDCVVIPACSGAPCIVDPDCGQLVVRPNVSFQRLDVRAKWNSPFWWTLTHDGDLKKNKCRVIGLPWIETFVAGSELDLTAKGSEAFAGLQHALLVPPPVIENLPCGQNF